MVQHLPNVMWSWLSPQNYQKTNKEMQSMVAKAYNSSTQRLRQEDHKSEASLG